MHFFLSSIPSLGFESSPVLFRVSDIKEAMHHFHPIFSFPQTVRAPDKTVNLGHRDIEPQRRLAARYVTLFAS